MSELARRVRERRAALGLSQEELADRMGYRSKSSITKLEKGVNDLPQSKLEELAAALDTTPAWLLGIETAAARLRGLSPCRKWRGCRWWVPLPAARPSRRSRTSRAISGSPPRGTRILP